MSPSGPPSYTWTWPNSQTERLPEVIAPGTTAFRLVEIEQLEPIPGEPVAAHGTSTGNGMSSTVAASPSPPGLTEFVRSVMRMTELTCSPPS